MRIPIIFTATLLLFSFIALAQEKPESYKISNGIEFHPGDSITLGAGSNPDGSFNFIYQAVPILPFLDINLQESRKNMKIDGSAAGWIGTISSIKKTGGKTFFLINFGAPANYIVEVDSAVKECELAACRKEGFLSQEEFEKLILISQSYQDGTINLEKFHKLRGEMMEEK
jgi:hypothetical protein